MDFGENRQKNAPKSDFEEKKTRKNFTDRHRNGQNCQVFGYIVYLLSEKDDNFYKNYNEKILQSFLKYVIIHKSDMR